ncbi:MAG: motility associated factor glycosyltransferase family protein [Spirochaetes bacterium]|nr:motility associated factor glycosyltransferase family protein [Spirochaetota bacterium]
MTISYKTENTKENLPTLYVETSSGLKYIHSRHFPSKEAETFPDFDTSSGTVTVILGLGLGHHLALKKFKADNQFIIIDILDNIEKETLKIYPQLIKPNIHIFSGSEKKVLQNAETILKNINVKKLHIIEHTASIRAFPAEYEKLKSGVSDIINSIAGNISTKNAFSGIYMRNILRRFSDLKNNYAVNSLKNIFPGIPALIISSAPSLDENIALIKKNMNRAVLICVDSALPALTANNIIPDFVVSIDPQPWITEHLKDYSSDFLLIESISSYNTALKQPKFISLNTHPLSQVIDHFYPDKTGSIDSGTGTVAGDAVKSAVLMGCNPVILTGMDFSFPDYNIYARGTSYQQRFSELFNSRFSTVETFNAEYIFRKSRNFKYNGINSRKSFLDYKNRLSSYLNSLETEVIHNIHKGINLDTKVVHNYSQIINNFPVIEKYKKEILTNLLTSNSQLKDIFDFTKITEFIDNDDIFNEICSSAEVSSEIKIKKYHKIQEIKCV